jgi:DNA polymerase-3 subunit alpha
VNIVDEQENIAVDLLSRKFMVNPNDELLHSLNDIPEVEFKVST